MDVQINWQLPSVPGIDQIELSFILWRQDPPGIDNAPPLFLSPVVHLGQTNRFPVPLPASYSLSQYLLLRPFFRDPANPFVRTPYVPQGGDVLQAMGSCGIFTAVPNPNQPGTWIITQQGSPSTASAGLYFPIGSEAPPTLPDAFIEPASVDPGATLPPLPSLSLTLIP